jgi:SAM-dependent methyltransferase
MVAESSANHLPNPEIAEQAPEATFDVRGYWERRLEAHRGVTGVGYLRLGRGYNEWLYRFRSEVFRQAIADWHLGGRPLDILDVGSGTGHYLREWLLAGAGNVTGSDLTEIAVSRLSEDFPNVPVRQLDITTRSLPTALGRYDVVSAFDMLFHIVDDTAYERALQNCFALCRPGGYFLFSELFLHHGRATVPHMVSRSLQEIMAMLRRVGFVPLDRRPMFVLMNYPADTTSRLAQLAWTAMVAPAMLSDRLGRLLGRALYPIERRLVRAKIESPTTELLLCRRPMGQ